MNEVRIFFKMPTELDPDLLPVEIQTAGGVPIGKALFPVDMIEATIARKSDCQAMIPLDPPLV